MRPTTPTIEIAGGSMSPTLPDGTVVWVDYRLRSPEPGDVVLLQGANSLIVHRLVHRTGTGDSSLVYHRGDLEGGIGVATGSAVIGRIVAIMEPDRLPIPGLADLSPGFRQRFRLARFRCRAHAICHRTASRLGLDRIGWVRSLGRIVRQRLL